MTNRELLERAAKAAGMWPQDFGLDDDNDPVWDEARGFKLAWGAGWWCPRDHDGDALRLAVKLSIGAQSHAAPHGQYSLASFYEPDGETKLVCELHDADPYAATRRAIVRAAAEMAK